MATSTRRPELAQARRAGLMNIGRAAAASGVSAKMIRHYESIGLLPAAHRTMAGYRVYDANEVHTLRFIRRARDLGFAIKEIAALVGLWQDRHRTSREVKRLVARHIDNLDVKLRELQSFRQALAHLADHCHGDDRPDCPILDDMATGATGATRSSSRNEVPRARG
jgi:MerR family transcriptional regulator, copper efflux regulator